MSETHKKIYTREEIPIADYLMSFQDALTKEFLDYHNDFVSGEFEKGELSKFIYPLGDALSNPGAWKTTKVKYHFAHIQEDMRDETSKFFPTSKRLTQEFGDDCPISFYSILEARSVIKRHTGPENRDGEFIRIHIPLIVPPGPIFFEVGGEVIDWSDIFGFDNQTIHSAHNYTDQRRLVYLIDIRRSRIGMPPGRPFDVVRDEHMQPAFDPKPHIVNMMRR
jgi:hypothetical protein